MRTVEIKRLKEGFYGDPKTGWSAYPLLFGFGEAVGGTLDARAVHVVAIYPGQVRGNHYHKDTNEMLLFFSGQGVFYWEEDGALQEHRVDGGPIVITIPAGIKHAFRNTGDTNVYLIAVRDGVFDPKSPDVVSSEVVAP